MDWFEAFGWAGSIFVVVSLMLANARRFRVLNFTGCAIALVYNAVLGIWPYTAMNLALCIINGYWIYRLMKKPKADAAATTSTQPELDTVNP